MNGDRFNSTRRLKGEKIQDRNKKLHFGQVKFGVTTSFKRVDRVELIGGICN